MKKNREIAIITAVSILSATPLLAGTWFNACVDSVVDYMTSDDCGVRLGKDSKYGWVCPISNNFIDPTATTCTPSVCNGYRVRGGKCVSDQWGWSNCTPNKNLGYGSRIALVGECKPFTNADGTVNQFAYPCGSMRETGKITQVAVECTMK